MDYLQAYPYLSELREAIDSALFQFDQLADAAAKWLVLREQIGTQAASGREHFDRESFHNALGKSGAEQTRMFDALEAFLAVWARISLLLFPLDGNDELAEYRRQRGNDVQELLNLTYPETLKNRDLRNAWMHFDERLDRAVLAGTWGSRQRFVHSSEAVKSVAHVLRLVEVDTLVIHFRDHTGASKSADLRELHRALQDANLMLAKAWAKLRSTEDEG